VVLLLQENMELQMEVVVPLLVAALEFLEVLEV
jgi:hypothetical protein